MLLVFDGLHLCIFVFEEGNFLLVLSFILVVILKLEDLLSTALEIHPQLLILFGQLLASILQLLYFLVALVVVLLHLHDLFNHLGLLSRLVDLALLQQ